MGSLEDLRPILIKVPVGRDIDVFAAALRKVAITARLEEEIAQIEQDCIPGGQLSSDPVSRAAVSQIQFRSNSLQNFHFRKSSSDTPCAYWARARGYSHLVCGDLAVIILCCC